MAADEHLADQFDDVRHENFDMSAFMGKGMVSQQARLGDEMIGQIVYKRDPENKRITQPLVRTLPQWRRQGVADLMMDRLREQHHDWEIDMGPFTKAGAGWFEKYAETRTLNKGVRFRLQDRVKDID